MLTRALPALGLALSFFLAGCGPEDSARQEGRGAQEVNTLPRVQWEVKATIPALVPIGHDSIFLDGATDVAADGGRIFVLHPREGRVAILGHQDGDVRLLGRPGNGPEEIPPDADRIAVGGGTIAIASRSSRNVKLWNMAGEFKGTVRLDEPLYDVKPIDVDGDGRVYTATVVDGSGGVRIKIAVHEVGRTAVTLGEFPTAPPFRIGDASRQLSFTLPFRYVRQGSQGRLHWAVGRDATVYVAYAGSAQIDSVRSNGSVGSFVNLGRLPTREVGPRELSSVASSVTVGGRTPDPSEIPPLEVAQIEGLLVAGSSLWVRRPGRGFRRYSYTTVDAGGEVQLSIDTPRPVAVAAGIFGVGWSVGTEYGERHLVLMAAAEGAAGSLTEVRCQSLEGRSAPSGTPDVVVQMESALDLRIEATANDRPTASVTAGDANASCQGQRLQLRIGRPQRSDELATVSVGFVGGGARVRVLTREGPGAYGVLDERIVSQDTVYAITVPSH